MVPQKISKNRYRGLLALRHQYADPFSKHFSASSPTFAILGSCHLPCFPLPAHVLTFLQLHPVLVTLTNAALHHSYPLDILLSKKVPPLILPFLPLLFTPEAFHQHHYLHAYFQGWELYQTANALIVLYENSGTVTIHTYGSVTDYYRLYLLVFSTASEQFYFSLLLQGTSPAPELAQLLLHNHIQRSFPPPLVPYAKLLPQDSELCIIADLVSTSLSNPTIYIPMGQHFTQLQLPKFFLAHWATSLFEPGSDTPRPHGKAREQG